MSEQRARALIVEDNVTVRTLLRELLTEWGFDVVAEATTGEEGVALAASLRPNVIVMDFRMPGIDGLVATRRILKEVAGARVVVISASEATNMATRAAAAGAFAYIPKGSAGELRRALHLAATA